VGGAPPSTENSFATFHGVTTFSIFITAGSWGAAAPVGSVCLSPFSPREAVLHDLSQAEVEAEGWGAPFLLLSSFFIRSSPLLTWGGVEDGLFIFSLADLQESTGIILLRL
jgi:hypothetical protein